MNPRIFKKLTKAAAAEIDRLGIRHFGGRFDCTDRDEYYPEITRGYSWERKSFYRWGKKITKEPMVLQGTVGYGQTTGYYEPEWSDSDALSCLFTHVIDTFTDWKTCDGENWPDNHCPEVLKASARHVINYAKTLTPEN